MCINKLTYYCFDYDDNLLHMNTKIHIEEIVGKIWKHRKISTSEFSNIRKDTESWRFFNNNESDSFFEFGDDGPRGKNAFMEDTINAIKNKKFAPSWNKFIKCLINGNILAIITARGHEPDTIKEVVKYIIYNVLTKVQRDEMCQNLLFFNDKFTYYKSSELIAEYLNNCDFYGVSSNDFKQHCDGNAYRPEKAKEIALKMFTERVHKFGKKLKMKVHIGFSDDDESNIEIIEKLFRYELSLKFPKINFNIYNTSNSKIKDGIRTKIKQ